MSALKDFEHMLAKSERRVWVQLTTPMRIQAFLDKVPYSVETGYRCPLNVLRERMGHCFDGA